ncbi:ZZ-type zinc finger-containing protein 3 [Linnemannia schmuckeri]|uniref:ZZ-type zinc finger-containing protein 3 n=1 Tax=Linnemannia schmuckeri TaxID=64567 RepID=A0A9P5RY22_9FUNG|nr:ZZ-type zinc finger-containing protein 3 [Linnemannia schmuckeri]
MSSIKAEGEAVPDSVAEPAPVVAAMSSDPTPAPTTSITSITAPVTTQEITPAITDTSDFTSTIEPSTLPASQLASFAPLQPPTPTTTVIVEAPPLSATAAEMPSHPNTSTQSKPNAGRNGASSAAATAARASTSSIHSPATLNGLERGPLGLAPDEEEWVRDKMEYALHDFQVLSLAIKRYRWQLGQVPKDISRLQSLKEKHMDDPFEFLRQVKSKEFRYPESQKTLPAPSIEWTKYQFPPANPVLPTKPQTTTFLNAMTISSNNDRSNGSNIVSLARSNRSRAGSPSYERLRTVKDTARNLGIHVSHHSHYQHLHSSQQYRHDSGANGVDEFANGSAGINDIDAFSRQASQEATQSGFGGHSQSPSVASKSQDMEGVTFTGQDQISTGFRARSAAVSESTSAPTGVSLSYYPTAASSSPSTHQTLPYIAPNNIANFEPTPGGPTNITISHAPGFAAAHHTSFSTSGNNNITYNHMSGSVDIQPGTTKGKGYSREGSGARDEPKPPLYNIPWSDDEQRLLEKLLDEFPDEPVAAQRFQKISAAMGTRTPKQVASRVQKYFIKLVKAGLEAPGRMNYSLETSKAKTKGAPPTAKGKKRKDGPAGEAAPKGKAGRPRKKEVGETGASGSGAATGGGGSGGGGSTKKQKPKSLLGSGSGRTSGTQYLHYSSAPTVYMSEEDDEDSVQDMLAASHTVSSSVPDGSIASHIGFSCDSCGVDPILGIRYSCIDCEELGGTDLCGPCYNSGVYHNELHLLSHRFHSIETSEVPSYSHSQPYRPASVGPSGTGGIYQS